MKKFIFILGIALMGLNAKSQIVYDSISMGASYANQVFYSLNNGTVANVDNNNWEIGFSVYGQGAAGSAIILNDANTELYVFTGDTADWNSFDTTGYTTWKRLLNSDTSWTNGAFNTYRGASGMFDMGWGVLNPQNNYWTFGDSLYLMKLNDNSYRKLWIVSLKTGVWGFKFSNLDGSNEQIITINKTDYPNRNFVYYSLINEGIIDREPDNSTWDILFSKHTDYLNPPGMYQNVTSVFSNTNVWSAKSNEIDYTAASNAVSPQTEFTQNSSNIGREWKKFKSSTGWKVRDSIAYFIYDNDSANFYRLVFTGFEGSATGKAFFETEKLVTTGINTPEATVRMSIYPNPSAGNLTLLLDYFEDNSVEILITDLSGRVVYQENAMLYFGINQKQLNLKNISTGIYMLSVYNDAFSSSEKIILK